MCSAVWIVSLVCLGNVVLGTSERGEIGAVDTGYIPMYTVEELQRKKHGKYRYDTRLEKVHVFEIEYMYEEIYGTI